jgi:hypothetical protein
VTPDIMPDASVPAAKLPDESMICFERRVRARFRSVLPRKNRPRVGRMKSQRSRQSLKICWRS